jgi:hypothetical protein
VKFFQDGIFYEIRQADEIEIQHCGDEREDNQQDGDAAAAKDHPESMPPARFNWGRHVRMRES